MFLHNLVSQMHRKCKTTTEKQQGLALLVALAGGAIAETQMYDKGFRGSTTDIFTEDTLRLIRGE